MIQQNGTNLWPNIQQQTGVKTGIALFYASLQAHSFKLSFVIDHNEKDGSMYILPKCIASIKNK